MTSGGAAGGADFITNALTVDVEDYFHVSAFERVVDRGSWGEYEPRVRRNTERLLDLFDELGVRATFFVLGWVAERDPGLLRSIHGRGHELASHGTWHRLLYSLSPGEFREDLRRSRSAIQDAAGVRVIGYRAPSFSITREALWALDVLAEEGFEYDASIYPVHHDRYGIASAPRHPHRIERRAGTLLEWPGSTVRIAGMNLPIGGGGYFRLLPYGWTRSGIRRMNAVERQPAIFYLHPWEVDPDQPRLPAPLLSRIRHYTNLHKTMPRLRRLLAEFRFAPIAALLPRVTGMPLGARGAVLAQGA